MHRFHIRGATALALGEGWLIQAMLTQNVNLLHEGRTSFQAQAYWSRGDHPLLRVSCAGDSAQEALADTLTMLERSIVDALHDYAYGRAPPGQTETITYAGRRYTRKPDPSFQLTRRWSITRPWKDHINLCLDRHIFLQVMTWSKGLQQSVRMLEQEANRMFLSWYRVV
jgi:hypothetical protein